MPTPTPSWSAPALLPEDLTAAAALCRETLIPVLDRDWSVPAGDLEWSCRRTLDHIVDTLLFYASQFASRANERRPPPRNGDQDATPAVLLEVLPQAAAILAEVARAAPPEARGFHPAGVADAAGFLGMGCEEVLMHTHDVALGLGVPFAVPAPLAAKVLARIFPWAPANVTAWESLQWCAGRSALPDRPKQDALWYWHCAPLSEWDGTIRRRAAPPQWR